MTWVMKSDAGCKAEEQYHKKHRLACVVSDDLRKTEDRNSEYSNPQVTGFEQVGKTLIF